MVRLVAIELENFQSLIEPTRIELAPITMLYGPNSAGKSAIYDALEFLRQFWDLENFGETSVQRLLRRWAHRAPSNQGELNLLSPRLAIEFQFEPNDPWDDGKHDFTFGGDDDLWHLRQLPKKVARLEASFRYRHASDTFDLDFAKVAVADIPWIELSRTLPVRAGNEVAAILGERISGAYWGDARFLSVTACEKLGNLLTPDVPTDEFHVGESLTAGPWGWFVDGQECPVAYMETNVSGLNPVSFDEVAHFEDTLRPKLSKGARDVFSYFSSQLLALLDQSPPVVRADRTIPTPKEAQTYISPNFGFLPRDATIDPNDPVAHLNGLGPGMESHWRYLATAAYGSVLSRMADESSWEALKQSAAQVSEAAKAFDRINGYLRDELFRERLYQVACKTAVLMTVPNEESLTDDELLLSEAALVRLLLKDGEQREIDLHDAGSGLSFVLPVLCAVARDGVAQLQQPELHLHAALQGDLADVLVARLNEGDVWQALVETHSEHLLLRLLRRVRDTTSGRAPALPLTTEDVAIYYFDPQVTGGTRVSRQAISPAGDFYVDWPRGFFRDRESDLFDE